MEARDIPDLCPEDHTPLAAGRGRSGAYVILCPCCGKEFPGAFEALRRQACAHQANAEYERGIE